MLQEPSHNRAEAQSNIALTIATHRGFDRLIAAARQAAADNRAKARSEAGRGAFKFAKLHEVASLTYDEDAIAMSTHGAPIHRSVDHYVETECAYRRIAERRIDGPTHCDLLAIAS